MASAMEPVMTQPTEGDSLKMWETDEGSMSLSGTFFCEMTTAQSLPRTPSDVMFAAVIALNAYSTWRPVSEAWGEEAKGTRMRTDLVEAALVREDGNVSVVACASCMTQARQ